MTFLSFKRDIPEELHPIVRQVVQFHQISELLGFSSEKAGMDFTKFGIFAFHVSDMSFSVIPHGPGELQRLQKSGTLFGLMNLEKLDAFRDEIEQRRKTETSSSFTMSLFNFMADAFHVIIVPDSEFVGKKIEYPHEVRHFIAFNGEEHFRSYRMHESRPNDLATYLVNFLYNTKQFTPKDASEATTQLFQRLKGSDDNKE